MQPKTIYLETMGCQMNVLDSELVLGQLRARGYQPIDDMTSADVVLLNTCSVRDHAEQKVLSRLGAPRRPTASHPDLAVGVVGSRAGVLLVSDRAPNPHPVDAETLGMARGAYRAAKHRTISVSAVNENHDWKQALVTAIRAGAQGYDTPPVPQFASNVGTAGLQKWHRLLTNPKEKKSWHRIFGEGTRAAIGLSRLYDCVTHAYTAPGAGRFLYAHFLEESGAAAGLSVDAPGLSLRHI